jgi:hypothetical protein
MILSLKFSKSETKVRAFCRVECIEPDLVKESELVK